MYRHALFGASTFPLKTISDVDEGVLTELLEDELDEEELDEDHPQPPPHEPPLVDPPQLDFGASV
jgi:hypothetical protein